jgi:hypothetical protein
MMKRVIWLPVFVVVLCIATGNLIAQSSDKVTRSVSGFTEVGFGIAGNLFIKTGPEFSVVLEGDRKYIDEVETIIKGNKLVIRKTNYRFFDNEKVDVYITMPELKGLGVSGSGVAKVEDNLKTASLYLDVSGSGRIIAPDINTEKFESSISGSGNINVKGGGEIAKGDISISGSGNFSGETVKFKTLEARISGSGSCTCNVAESLDASISGSGSVNYSGNPKVNARVSGSGRVRSR